MAYTNEIKITLNTNTAAQTALNASVKALLNNAEALGCRPSMKLAEGLKVIDNTVITDYDEGYFLPEGIADVMEVILAAIAEELRDETFECTVFSDSDYSCDEIAATFANRKLNIKETYLPSGFVEYLCCPECGEEVVRVDEYNAGETYYCPECGEEIDLSEEYEACAPKVTETTINI